MKICSILIDNQWYEVEYTEMFPGDRYHRLYNGKELVALVPVTMLIVSGRLKEEGEV